MRHTLWTTSAFAALALASFGVGQRAQANEPAATSALAAIDQAAARGEISNSDAILYRLYQLKGSANLPAKFRISGGAPIKCATEITTDARVHLNEFAPAIQEEILALLARPTLNSFEDTAHFRVHFSTTGANIVWGWPNRAYLDATKLSAETSWTFYHTTKGWQAPPSDGTNGGGNNLIDLYIDDLGTSVYGVTYAESPVAGGYPNDYTAYFIIDNDYTGFGYSDRTLPMQVTVAHEYHHVVQMGYVINISWWMENMSTFMEDEVYDSIDDNYNYMSFHTTAIFNKMSTANGAYEYGSFIWPTFLKENWDHSLVKDVETCSATTNIFTCFDTALAPYASDYASAQAEFNVWNFYMSAARNDGNHYIEAGTYPVTPAYDKQYTTYPQSAQHPTTSPERRPEATAYSIQRFKPQTGSADNQLTITFDGPDCTKQVCVIAKEVGSATFHEYYMALDATGHGSVSIPDFTTAQTEFAHMIVSMPRTCGNGRFDYVFGATMGQQPVAVDDAPLYVRTVDLEQNSPNPFGPVTRIAYTLRADGAVRLSIVDASGRVVRDLIDAQQPTGQYSVRWDGRDDQGHRLAPGVYFYRLNLNGDSATRKLILMN
ncbi:MAG: MXAN_6640 family putative metalloprotease [Candidatus Eisenbacteria bacterium]